MKIALPDMAALRESGTRTDIVDAHQQLERQVLPVLQRDELTASERREVDKAQLALEELRILATSMQVDRTGVVDPRTAWSRDSDGGYAAGQPLRRSQTLLGYARSQLASSIGEDEERLSFDRILRGITTGRWQGADREQRAMSGLSNGAGGVFLPTTLSAGLIDLARNVARVSEAGARLVPMDSRTVDVPAWTGDPTPGWRAELDPITESNATVSKVTLAAKTLAVYVRVARELVEDANIVEGELQNAFAASFANAFDSAALYGTGSSNQPLGIKNVSGVTKTALATNGRAATWADLVGAVGRLRDVNEEPTAMILSDRTARGLALIADTTGQYVPAPSYLDGIARLATGQVPNNLTQGSSSVASDVFVGDFRQLFLGVHIGLTITRLNERFMTDSGAYGYVAWFRGDVQVARPSAFQVLTGAL